MKVIVSIIAILGMSAVAHADLSKVNTSGISNRAWKCAIAFKGESKGIRLILGNFKSVATGNLQCFNLAGDEYSQNVRIQMGGKIFSLSVGIGKMAFAGSTSEISLANSSPEVILGKYAVLNGDAAIIGGVGGFTGVKVGLPQLAFNVGMKISRGVGFNVGIDKMTITAIGEPSLNVN